MRSGKARRSRPCDFMCDMRVCVCTYRAQYSLSSSLDRRTRAGPWKFLARALLGSNPWRSVSGKTLLMLALPRNVASISRPGSICREASNVFVSCVLACLRCVCRRKKCSRSSASPSITTPANFEGSLTTWRRTTVHQAHPRSHFSKTK